MPSPNTLLVTLRPEGFSVRYWGNENLIALFKIAWRRHDLPGLPHSGSGDGQGYFTIVVIQLEALDDEQAAERAADLIRRSKQFPEEWGIQVKNTEGKVLGIY